MSLDVTPVEGYVALQIVDDETEEEREARKVEYSSGPSPNDDYNKAITAIVVGIGPKGPKNVKRGSVVMVRKYARDGLRLSDDTVLVESYCIVALVGGK